MNYFSFDAEVLFAFFVFGDTFFMLGLMVHIGLGSDRRRLEDLFEKSDMKMENGNMGSESSKNSGKIPWNVQSLSYFDTV